jgi:hypothetical protein
MFTEFISTNDGSMTLYNLVEVKGVFRKSKKRFADDLHITY